MPLDSKIVGQSGEPLTHAIDARWTMAYAAGLGEFGPAYVDTVRRPDVLAHPVFPVCFEWPAFLSQRHLPTTGLTPAEAARGVHAMHDLELHKSVRAGTTVTTTATVMRIEARRSGAYQLSRLESVDENGERVCTSWYGNLMRGVEVVGGDRAIGAEPEPISELSDGARHEVEIPIAPNAAHVYTECARIWNPIHTDAAVAAAAGLPAIILHGTATLALAVSRVVDVAFGGAADRVGRLGGRFGAMVLMPSVLKLAVHSAGDLARFEVLTEKGDPAIRGGWVALRP